MSRNRFLLETQQGRATVLTAWIIRHAKDFPVDNFLCTLNDEQRIKLHNVVALLEHVSTKHFESGRPLLLRRGQIGTVVMIYQDGPREVEFADRDGRAFAILPLRPDQLMLLHDTPDFAAA